MQYTKYQRFTSFFVLFFFLFSITFRITIPLLDVFADEEFGQNIVSILIEEEIYDSLKGDINTYANNISGVLNNTQVVILPTPKNTTAYEIASVNESLYFEGLKSLNNGSRNAQLIGTVIVGNLALPIAYENNNTQKTIVPYIDFEDKYFIFNLKTGKYEKNENNSHGLKSEIWQGVISPNLGSKEKNISAMKDFFKKSDSFYKGKDLFSKDKGVLNGKTSDIIPEKYSPNVFYFDQIRENQGVNLDSYNAYQAYLENKEDIIYNRFNQELADKIKERVLGSQKDSMEGLQEIFGDTVNLSEVQGPDLKNVPDIQSRYLINKTTKKFVEIFSQGSIGKLRKNVHNAGRYNYENNAVNVDFVPYLITILDSVNDEIVKEANDDLELQIDNKIKDQLENDIYIPYRVEIERDKYTKSFTDVYINLLSGKNPADIIDAAECTAYRGSTYSSGTIVLGNRGLVMGNIESDMDLLKSIDTSMNSTNKICMRNIQNGKSLTNVFGGNTPVNIDTNSAGKGDIRLNSFNTSNSLVPVFDISGAYIPDSIPYNSTNYQQCLNNNFFAFTEYDVDDILSSPEVKYQLPALGQLPGKDEWSCIQAPKKVSFNEDYESLQLAGKCSGLTCTTGDTKYYFKKVSSIVTHKEPTKETIQKQIQAGITPALPIDRERFIDYKDSAGNYKKTVYPKLLQFTLPEGVEYTFVNFDTYFKKYLQEKTSDFENINFYDYLQSKENKILKIGDDEKELSYYDSLVFAMYWNNFNSISGKYKFIFQNYLSDQFTIKNQDKVHLPKNKKQYEIAYLGAPGDSENMYIQMNPEAKADNPYADVIEKNAKLQTQLLAKNLGAAGNNPNKENVFKCAPPEGVPIWEWIPAVICWLEDMLPPTITINTGNFSSNDSSENTTNSTGNNDTGNNSRNTKNISKEDLDQCNGDENKNGINDCLEKYLSGADLDINSDGDKYYYNSPGKIEVDILDSSGKKVDFNITDKIELKLRKIEIKKDDTKELTSGNRQVVFSEGDDIKNAKKYINFTPSKLRPQSGGVLSYFSTKGIDANYIFEASMEILDKDNKKEIILLSDPLRVEVRGDRLFSTLYEVTIDNDTGKIISNIGSNDIVVSEQSQIFLVDSNIQKIGDIQKNIFSRNTLPQKSILSLENLGKSGNKLPLNYPLTVELVSDSGQVIINKKVIYKSNMTNFYSLSGVKKTGSFTLKITDSNGFISKKELNFVSEIADRFVINMGASVMESNGSVTSNVVTILDKFNNVIIGRPYTLDLEINGESIVFEQNKEESISNPVLEGYKIFRLLSKDITGTNTIKISLKNFIGETILSDEKILRVVDDISINIVENKNIKVGGDTYNLELQLVGNNNSIYSDINSRVYVSINPVYGQTTQVYFPVINGKANVTLKTTTLAGKNIPLEIKVEGMKSIYEKNITINHGTPEYIQLGTNKVGIEAAEGNTVDIQVFVKDQFGNITFNSNVGNVNIEVKPKYEKYITSNVTSVPVIDGISTLSVGATDLPGMGYFKVNINGLEAVGKIETYFYWNKESIKDTSYNALYTTLLGAPYGDITKKDYLAGALLFDKDNKALAVTSLLNNPFSRNDVVMLEHNGGISSIANPSDLSTDIQFTTSIEDKKIIVSIKNNALGNYIGKIVPVLGGNTELNICNGNSGDFSSCNISTENTSIVLQSDSEHFNGYSDSNSLYIQDNFGRKIFTIDKNGTIERNGNIYFEVDTNSRQKYLQIKILSGGVKIGEMIYNFVGADIKSSRNETLFNKTKSVLNNTILLLLSIGQYNAEESYSEGNNNKIIYFNSPFDVKNQLNDFTKGNLYAYENFSEKSGVGWSEGNKTLLQFASGESVGESVKPYQTFGVITLGDPVLRLKKIQRTHPKVPGEFKRFDPTIGIRLSDSQTVESYEFLDYNDDNKQDIILIHSDKYVELLENTNNEKNYRSRGNLLQIFDLGSYKNIKTGDFTGDGYDDIFFVNNQGEPYMYNNFNKDYLRVDLREQFGLSGKILQAETFDMDNDKKDDIIILDESGDITIFYGGGTNDKPIFRDDSMGLTAVSIAELSSELRTDKGAIYFKGLVSLGKAGDNSDIIRDSDVFMDAIKQNAENLSTFEGSKVNTDLLDNLVFVKIPYKFNDLTLTPAESMIDGMNIPLSDDLGGAILKAQTSVSNFITSNTQGITYPDTLPEVSETDFIRSEYAEVIDVDITKKYIGDLKKGATVNFELNIKNNSNKTLEDIAYVEDILGIFTLDETTLVMSKDVQIRYDIPGFEFLIDEFTLAPGETFTLKVKLSTAPVKLGFIRVGLFEKDESGDDLYGDIIYSKSAENCGKTLVEFRSCETDIDGNNIDDCTQSGNLPRFYRGGETKTPVCDSELPPEIQKNVTDDDGNGVPDYIDDIINGSKENLQAYASGALEDILKDSDGDGIPDNEDTTQSDKDFLSNLSDINENVDYIMSGIDNIVQGISCGFGGGGCIATPLNWAPLAPGGDPTLFGVPIGDGLKVGEGIPVFSALTWIPPTGVTPPIPAVWPGVMTYWPIVPGDTGTIGAGGYLGTKSPSNFFRLFVTPTLTGGMGVAACFGGPAEIAGYANMPGLSPLLPGGNCIVTATPLAKCASDGSDGDASSLGPSSTSGNRGGVSIINANCSGDKNINPEIDLDLVQEYLDYKVTGNKSKNFEDLFKESFRKIADKNQSSVTQNRNGPLISLNGESLDDELAVNIDFGAAQSGDFSDIIQIQNRRISPFPDFLMGWVTRQIEEIVTKLTDFPTVFIILPDFSGVLDFGNKTSDKAGVGNIVETDENLDFIGDSEAVKTVNSGIKTAYTFLANTPLVQLEQENISVEIPWIDSNEIAATKEKWGNTVDQWNRELERAKNAWSFGQACSYTDIDKQKECEERSAVGEKIILQTENLIGSLEKNVEVIESYKDFPKQLNKLVQKKEEYLEQILYNVESISNILGGWIGSNGERFKAWVELYILIKAILKSWQLLIDVFVDYEAQCSSCKNERGDLMGFIWKMISVIIPDIPVIQFPKWPDIIMDLHNIRAGLVITLPEFSFGTRPILLPNLPNLYLPDVPTLSISLPELPILPIITIPELPDLPMLPTVELPNLPPPPMLPKMFTSLEGVLEIIRAVTKAMCILKTSPFVPEWRAGDQIAFLTERQGYLPTDFIDISLPQFSYPFVDAIKVTTFVNLEFETDFISELARQITMPLTTFSNDFTQILNLGVNDLDFSQTPSFIDINLGSDGTDAIVGYSQQDKAVGFAIYAARGISEFTQLLDNGKNKVVSNSDFKRLISQTLASKTFAKHPRYNEFRSLWDEVLQYNFEKEDEFIAGLQKNNTDKFDTLKNILYTEILKNKNFRNNIEKYLENPDIQKVSANTNNNEIVVYNDQLSVYNNRFKESALALVNANGSPEQQDLQNRGDALLSKVNTPLQNYSNGKTVTSVSNPNNSCQQKLESAYKFTYEGLYVEMKPQVTYRLMDYLDELNGKEEINSIDVDNDGDSDVIYMMNGEIFIKENLNTKPVFIQGGAPITIQPDDNVFYNNDTFYSAVNNFEEGSISSTTINADFSSSTQSGISNYRLEFTRLVDRSTKKKSIVDSFTDIEQITFDKENENFIYSQNLAFIKNLGKLKNLELTTKELINIKDDLENDRIVDISAGTKIYAGNTPFRISYTQQGSNEIAIVVVGKNQNIEIQDSIKIVGISGDAYIQARYEIVLQGEEIRSYLGRPIFPGAFLEYVGDSATMDALTYAEINYYDGSKALLNFNFIEKYWLYDLGGKSKDYSITLSTKNDYLYAQIRSFKEKVFSTYSKQILLSPQVVADNITPSLYLPSIKIPVYQEKSINIGEVIYDDGGLAELQPIRIDMDLEVDSDGDGNTKNDSDIPAEKIIQTPIKVSVIFGKYDFLVKKKIGIILRDKNNNESLNTVLFEVYSPTPEIQSVVNNSLTGLIDEELDQEPVSLYRYRGGVISKLVNKEGDNTSWTNSGDYNFEVDTQNTGLTLKYGEKILATIGEKTGKITLEDSTIEVQVFSSNDENNNSFYPKIEIQKDGSAIYYQYLQVSDVKNITPVQSFDSLGKLGIYTKFTDSENYSFYSIPDTVSYNPGAFVIYKSIDPDKEPLFILYPDGRIDTLNQNYTLKYSSYNDSIVLQLMNAEYNKEIAQVLFKIDGGYIMK